MNETPATVRMIDGATAPVISNVFVNNACAVCTLQITGTFTAATVLVEGIVNVASNQWVTLAAFNLSDLSLEKDGADKAGIYQVGIEGILRVRMNVTEISGGDITIAAQFGNATINQFSKTEASNLIPITAYDLAVAGGYTGTLEQFEADMGNSASNATAAANSADEAAQTLTDVQTAGTEAVDAVQAKGQEVLASIPEDYTELTGEVDDLKTQIDDVNDAYGDIQISKQFPANSRYSNYDIPLSLSDGIDCIVCLLSLNSENFQTCIIYGYDGSNYNELGRIANVGGYTKFTIPSTITALRIGPVLTANDANKPIWKGWVLFSDKNGTNNVLFDEIISLNGNLQSKIGNSDLPFVTPQMYGAVGDGVNDDTTALQNAIDSGKRVLVPEGQYMVSAPLVISKQGTIIEGVNNRSWGTYKQCAELTLKSGVYMDAFIQLTGNANNTVIKNLVMWGGTTSYQPSSGIFFNSTDSEFVSDIVIENVTINYCGFGINIDSIFKSLFSNVRIANCRQYGFKLSGKTSGEYASDGTTLTLINCYALYCARSYTFERIRYSSLINCASDACTVYDYSLKTCSGVSFINCGCEQSKGNPFFMQGTNQGVSITGFEVIALDELSSGLEDALISCYGMVNCVISGITIASVTKRDVEILDKSPAYTSISVLDNSINPAKCNDISDGCIRFLAREIVYTNLASPDFAGQIRMGNNSVEIGVNNNGTLEWASLLN